MTHYTDLGRRSFLLKVEVVPLGSDLKSLIIAFLRTIRATAPMMIQIRLAFVFPHRVLSGYEVEAFSKPLPGTPRAGIEPQTSCSGSKR